ncbi:MAG: CTP synthetase [Halanaeroarchaeum sp.]
MNAVIVGPDRGLGAALADHGVGTTRVEGPATGEALDAAGLAGASLLVITDLAEATAVPVAKDRNPDVRVVSYAPTSVPEFVTGQLDLAVDPDLLAPAVVAEELVVTVE